MDTEVTRRAQRFANYHTCTSNGIRESSYLFPLNVIRIIQSGVAEVDASLFTYTKEARKYLEVLKDIGELLIGINVVIILKMILSKYY